MGHVETADVVIVGGGIIGASVAYHLVADGRAGAPSGGRPGRVVVLERDPSYARASFALATGGVRQQFGHRANVAMARHAIGVYERFADLLAVDGEPGECHLRQVGYLFLADDRTASPLLHRFEANRALGVEVERLDHAAILMRIPDLDLGGIRFAILGRRDGSIDPRAIQRTFERASRRLGAEWIADEAVAVDVEAGRVAGVATRGGRRIATRTLVDACGAWAARLGDLAGAPVPVTPVRRQLHEVAPAVPIDRDIPLVIDPTGVHFRADPDGTLRIGEGPDGGRPEPDPDAPSAWAPDGVGFAYDPARFHQTILPILARRLPPLARSRLVRGWAGLYEVSPDHNALLGEHPERPGFLVAAGFSGHGVMMAPAAGLALAELIRLGRSATLDIVPFRLSRFAEGEAITEEGML